MKHVFLFLPLFLLFAGLGLAQETTINHRVESGDTVFKLSRTYNVSPQEIYDLNPGSEDIIKIGEELTIPKSTSAINQSNKASNADVITYAVVYGDTKFSLAKRFGISVEALEQQNPHTKNGLQAGHILKIDGQKKSSPSGDFTIIKTHSVLKGQTLWGISKANGITVEELVNANSDILRGILQIGQLLKIPDVSENRSNSDSYLVQRGDTKFGLAKKYNISIAELEDQNPQIKKLLMAGQTIKIPTDQDDIETNVANDTVETENGITKVDVESNSEAPEISEISQEFQNTDTIVDTTQNKESDPPFTSVASDSTDSDVPKIIVDSTAITKTPILPLESTIYVNYEIKAKETLYGLSKKAGMRISEFVELNPQLVNGAKIGMIIQMPTSSSDDPTTLVTTGQPTEEKYQRYSDLTTSIETTKKNKLLIVLPFSETKYNLELNLNIGYSEVKDDFIKSHLDFYRGSKIAQDSVRALGLDFNIDILETNDNSKNTKAISLTKEANLENYDAIMVPFYENDLEGIAGLIQDKNIPLITVSKMIKYVEADNIYNALPSLNTKRETILNYISKQNGNLIVVCDVNRSESKTFITSKIPNAIFIEVNKKGTYDTDELISQLDSDKTNYVILESEKNSVFLSTTNALLGQLSKYSIHLTLLDKSLLPSTDNVSNKRFIILQMMYPSLTSIVETSLSNKFTTSYKNLYGIEPSENVKFGFDLTYDTLLRLSQAHDFQSSATNDVTEYTILKLDYKPTDQGSFDNHGVYIIQYNSDGSIKELK